MTGDYYDPKFFGTANWYRYPLGGFVFTDSVKYFCETKGAYWTLDVIGSYQFTQEFLVLTFDLTEDGGVIFTAKEDTYEPELVRQDIPFTDLDVSVMLYWENGVVLFPSDH